MRFAHPEYLYLFGVIPILLVFYFMAFRKKARDLTRFGNPELMARLARSTSAGRQKLKAGLTLCGVACFVVALARPQLGSRMETVKRSGHEIMIALDVSNSMMVEDVKPNRLERARHAIRALTGKLDGDRVGLVVFAGAAYLQCPMTTDYSALELFLSGVDTQTVGLQGTAVAEAMRTAMKSFSSSTQKHKVIVLLTDGENHEDDPVSVASELAAQGVRVYPIGVGTPFGEPIPIRDERGSVVGYKKDENGSVVMSRLDEATLQQIASTTGGVYYRSTLAEGEIGSLMEEIGKLDAAEFESREFTRYEERYQIALALGLLFLIIELALSDRRLPGAQWMGRFE